MTEPSVGRTKPLRNLLLAGVVMLAACSREEAPATPDEIPAATSGQAASTVPDAAAAGIETGRPVDAETLPYADVAEKLVYGYFAFPSDMVEPLPALLLVHDWWGLDDNMRAAADRLAAAGYIVLAVDLYRGATASDATKAREQSIAVVERPDAVDDNLRQALEFVEVAGAPSIGIVGWGFGGVYALNAGLAYPGKVDAIVLFYGQVPGSTDRLATLDAPVLGLYGEADASIPVSSVEAFESATHRLGVPAEVEIYDGAGHGFADPKRRQYDPALAASAWQRMLGFLAANLRAAGDDSA